MFAPADHRPGDAAQRPGGGDGAVHLLGHHILRHPHSGRGGGAAHLRPERPSVWRPLGERLLATLRLAPCILLTAIFRIGTYAIMYNSLLSKPDEASLPAMVFFGLVYAPPFLLILILKRFQTDLQLLSPLDILVGLFDESSSCALWGRLGREGSRLPQLVVALHHLLLLGGYCTWTAILQPSDPATDLRLPAVVILCSGLLSVVFFLRDIFYLAEESDTVDPVEDPAGGLELVQGTVLERGRGVDP